MVAVAALAGALVAAPASLAANGGNQGGSVGQSGLALANAVITATTNGGSCFAGCPTTVVNTNVAVALSFNVAQITQALSQIDLHGVGSPTIVVH